MTVDHPDQEVERRGPEDEDQHGRLRRAVTPRRLLTSFLLAGAVVGLVYAFSSSVDEATPEPPIAVTRVFPIPNDLQLRQESIGYELADGFTGALRIDATEIPDDQLDRIAGINRISYTAADGKETGRLDPGPHCAVAIYWDIDKSRDESETYRWCFDLH